MINLISIAIIIGLLSLIPFMANLIPFIIVGFVLFVLLFIQLINKK